MSDPHCPRCQAPSFEDTRYCWSCGFDLGDPETRVNAAAMAPPATDPAAADPAATAAATADTTGAAPGRSGQGRLLRYGAAALVAVVVIGVVANLPGLTGPATSPAPSGAAGPSASAAAAASPEPWASLAPTGRTTAATVTRIVDGDTIVVDLDGTEQRVRYIGMDTPETVKPDTPVQPMGEEAAAANAALVGGQAVVLEQDVSDTDRFGRLLRDVWVRRDGVLVLAGLELVREGYAQISTFPPDVRYASMLLAAQQDAQHDEVGLWASSAGASPSASAPVASLPTFTSVTPVIVTSGHKSSFRGAIGVYTWRDVRFEDPAVRMTWDVHSNLASGCRIDWRIQPLDGPAVQGSVKVKGKGRTTGKRNLAVPVGDAPLEVRSTCSEWLLTMQGKAAS
jgi:endonuclease YncB( thermonuclease family)